MKYWALLRKVDEGFALGTLDHDLPTGRTVTCLALFTSMFGAQKGRTRCGFASDWQAYVLEPTFYELVSKGNRGITHVVVDPGEPDSELVPLPDFVREQQLTSPQAVDAPGRPAPSPPPRAPTQQHVWVMRDKQGNRPIFSSGGVMGLQVAKSQELADEATNWLRGVGEFCDWERITVDELVRLTAGGRNAGMNGWFWLLQVDDREGPQFVPRRMQT